MKTVLKLLMITLLDLFLIYFGLILSVLLSTPILVLFRKSENQQDELDDFDDFDDKWPFPQGRYETIMLGNLLEMSESELKLLYQEALKIPNIPNSRLRQIKDSIHVPNSEFQTIMFSNLLEMNESELKLLYQEALKTPDIPNTRLRQIENSLPQ